MNELINDVVVEEAKDAAEVAVVDEVANAAVEEAADNSVAGCIIAGIISILGVIGLMTVIKKICSGVNSIIQKIKDKKAAKQRAKAQADAEAHPENYYTEADVKAEEEVVEE